MEVDRLLGYHIHRIATKGTYTRCVEHVSPTLHVPDRGARSYSASR
jgi:hypothetical protein